MKEKGDPMTRCLKSMTLATLLLAGCGGPSIDNSEELLTRREQKYSKMDSMFGDDWLMIGNPGDVRKEEERGIGVSKYLWQASLDTLSFMPLASADPFGGLILTDWYQDPKSPTERLKVNVRILSADLRGDGLSLSVFRQKQVGGQWVDQVVDPKTTRELEDAILTRARQLRISGN